MSDEQAIRDLVDARAKALYAKNADAALKGAARNIVSFDLAPPLAHLGAGTQAKEGLDAWFKTWKGPIGWSVRDVTIETADTVAFAYGLGHMTGDKQDGEHVDLWCRVTLGFRKRKDGWEVVHEHTSVPFYMDGSLRAAVDLKP